jgi:hypothetical protein
MTFKKGFHLTYCTNIHPGETWDETFGNLKEYIPSIKEKVNPGRPFGIGLRVSDIAARELLANDNLFRFRQWLEANGLYVFTINGFPYGGFHRTIVKDKVHLPDWNSRERIEYTARLIKILNILLPQGVEGGISTSPVSYRHWFKTNEQMDHVLRKAAFHFAVVVEYLMQVKSESGKVIHLDIEPEPDGIVEDTRGMINFYNNWLLPVGVKYLSEIRKVSTQEAEAAIREHIRVCFDVCHASVVFENPVEMLMRYMKEKIRIGKIQLSAALKFRTAGTDLKDLTSKLRSLSDKIYLHQVAGMHQGEIKRYKDLPDMLNEKEFTACEEWRIHYHVPLFLSTYGILESTQEDILNVFQLLQHQSVTNALEIETYTWSVLPDEVKMDLTESIVNEFKWVLDSMKVQYQNLWIK